MTIDTQEILRHIAQQKEMFSMLGTSILSGEHTEGVIAGLDLVKSYLETYETQMGEDIARRENS